jgi:hypothetical protein
MILLLALLQQPVPPATVGDTLWATRTVRIAAGDNVRPAPWDLEGPVQILGRPLVITRGDQAEIRYPLVAWEAGDHQLDVPGPIVTHPSGVEDTLPAQSMTFVVHSVLPAGVPDTQLKVQPPATTVLRRFVSPFPVIVLSALAALLLLPLFWWWRRRGTPVPPVIEARSGGPSEDLVRRWADAGERRVVAGVAANLVRSAIAELVPSAHEGLDTASLIEEIDRQRPNWPRGEIASLLASLDSLRFAPTDSENVLDLYQRSVGLVQDLRGAGA